MEDTNGSQGDLEKRVQSLEFKIQRIEANLFHSSSDEPEVAQKPIIDVEDEPTVFSVFFLWIKQDFLMKLGAFMLILALAWFVRYSFAQNWLGPIGRISLGLLAGLGLLGFGYKVIPKKGIPGQVLTATGATMMLVTLSAAWFIYALLDPYSVLMMMSLIVALTALVAVTRKTLALAILALIGGMMVPFLAGLGLQYPLELLSYVFLLDLGVFAIVAMRGWRVLILLAIIASSLYTFSLFDLISNYTSFIQYNDDFGSNLFTGFPFSYSTIYLFMGLFSSLFFATNLFAIFRTKTVKGVDLWTQGITALVMLLWVNGFVPDEWKSLVLVGISLAAMVVVYLLWRESKIPPQSMYIHAVFAVVAFGAATAFELSGTALVVAFAFESLALLFLSSRIVKDPSAVKVASFSMAIPILYSLSVNRFDSFSWREMPLFNEHFFVLVVFILVLSMGAFFLRKAHDSLDPNRNYMLLASSYLIGVCVGVFMLIWLALHNILKSQDVAREVALIIFALIGVVLLFNGVTRDMKNLGRYGSIIIGGVILRLLLVEVWLMPLSGRVVTFVLVGLMFVGTAFFQKKHLLNK